jgi:hypothetical protein
MTAGKPTWRKLCQEALLEPDPQNLPEKIARAEVAVDLRLRQLNTSGKNEVEQKELREALDSLKILKKLHFPGWNLR